MTRKGTPASPKRPRKSRTPPASVVPASATREEGWSSEFIRLPPLRLTPSQQFRVWAALLDDLGDEFSDRIRDASSLKSLNEVFTTFFQDEEYSLQAADWLGNALVRAFERSKPEPKERADWNRAIAEAVLAARHSHEVVVEESLQSPEGASEQVSTALDNLIAQPAVEALALAISTFGDAAAAKRFLSLPNAYFEGDTPLGFALSHRDGQQRLRTFLHEVQHGLPA